VPGSMATEAVVELESGDDIEVGVGEVDGEED
jgi:hypothetical protein